MGFVNVLKWPRRTAWGICRVTRNEALAELGQAYKRKRRLQGWHHMLFQRRWFYSQSMTGSLRETSVFSELFYRSTVRLDVWQGQYDFAIWFAPLGVSTGQGFSLFGLTCQVRFPPCWAARGMLQARLICTLFITYFKNFIVGNIKHKQAYRNYTLNPYHCPDANIIA